jgi:hypothetical protein
VNEELAAIGRFVQECVMRSGNYSLQITYGIRVTERGSKRVTPPQRQWYVTAHAGPKVIMRVSGDLATALERTLDVLRKEPTDIAQVEDPDVQRTRRADPLPCLAGLLYGLSWFL